MANEDFLSHLTQEQRFKVVLWSSFARKRYLVFETWMNRGMASRPAYKKAQEMSHKEVRHFCCENYEYLNKSKK